MTPKGADGRGREDAVCGECGHAREQHDGHTYPAGFNVPPDHCSACRCRSFREPAPAKGGDASDPSDGLSMPELRGLQVTQAASGSRPDFSEAETRLPDRSAASSLAEQTGGLRGGEGNSAPSASSQPRRAVGQSDQPVTQPAPAKGGDDSAPDDMRLHDMQFDEGLPVTQAASGSRPDSTETAAGGTVGDVRLDDPHHAAMSRPAVGRSDQLVTHLSDEELARIEALTDEWAEIIDSVVDSRRAAGELARAALTLVAALREAQYWRERHCHEYELHAERAQANWKRWKEAEQRAEAAERERDDFRDVVFPQWRRAVAAADQRAEAAERERDNAKWDDAERGRLLHRLAAAESERDALRERWFVCDEERVGYLSRAEAAEARCEKAEAVVEAARAFARYFTRQTVAYSMLTAWEVLENELRAYDAARDAVPKLVAALQSARTRLGDCCYTNDPCPRAEAAERECEEQARLNGKGAQREAKLMARLAAAEQRAEAAERERDELREGVHFTRRFGTPFDPTGAKTGIEIQGLRASLAAAESERDALRGALKPFADALANPHEYATREGTSDSVTLYGLPECRYITVGDLRRAKAAYDAAREGGE